MKKFFFILIASSALNAQTKSQIDSLNALPYDIKINQASKLLKVYEAAARQAAKTKYPTGEAASYSNAALLYYYRGKHDLAAMYRTKAINIYEAIGNTKQLSTEYGELGYSMKRRNMKQAEQYMQKGISIGQAAGHRFELAGLYDNYGVLKEMQNQLDSALMFYNKSLVVKREFKDSIGIPYSLSNIAGVHVLKKEFGKAVPYYDQVIAIRQMRNDKIGLTETYGNIAWMHAENRNPAQAITAYNQAIGLALQTGYIHYAANLYRDLSKVYERAGQIPNAFEAFKKHNIYKDSVLNKETNTRLAELEVEFDTANKEKLLIQRAAEVKQRNTLLAGISIIAVFIGFVGYLIYRQQKLKNRQLSQEHELKSAIVQIENQNNLQDQRLAISRDLHDNIGSQLTFIISSIENIRYAFGIQNTTLETKLQSISGFARDTIVELRDTIWAMNHSAISFEDLRSRILNFIEKARESMPETKFDVWVDQALTDAKLTSVEGMNLYRTLQEAVNNAIKYSGASAVAIRIEKTGDTSTITIIDNGLGFDQLTVQTGNGLGNMKKRMDDIGATFDLKSVKSQGTRITLTKPIQS